MKKISDFGGNTELYNFYIRAHKIFSEMESQKQAMLTTNNHLEEDTTVNMNPYKEAIQNSESSKSIF
jgi:hypothetical protein